MLVELLFEVSEDSWVHLPVGGIRLPAELVGSDVGRAPDILRPDADAVLAGEEEQLSEL